MKYYHRVAGILLLAALLAGCDVSTPAPPSTPAATNAPDILPAPPPIPTGVSDGYPAPSPGSGYPVPQEGTAYPAPTAQP